MRIRTVNARKRRNFWKRKVHAHIRFNRGIWLRHDVIDPTGEWPEAQQTIDGREQPRAYRVYP